MSRAKTIVGATLSSLILLGVVVALAQTAQKPPTELYVRTNPPGAKIIVDGKPRGISPRLFEVEPGQHTMVVKLAGHAPKTKKMTVRKGRIRRVILELQRQPKARDQKLEAVARKTAWGEAVEGVQLKAYAEQPIWIAGDTPALRADMRNTGGNRFKKLVLYSDCWELELDGRWYGTTVEPWGITKVLPFGPGTQQTGLVVPLWEHLVWQSKDGNKPLQFLPGRHTIRVAFCLSGMQESEMSDVHTRRGPETRKERVVSRAMQVEVRPASADQPAWGPAVEGVQIRLWVEKKTWRVDEEMILKVDCRNQGKRDLMLDGRTGCFDVYVDHRRYSPDPNTIYLVWPAPFGPGRHYNGRPIGLGRYPGLELAPGKHTIRVVLKATQNTVRPVEGARGGTTLNKGQLEAIAQEIEKGGSQPPVVVSSNSIEIEIVAAEAATGTGVPGEVELSPRELFSASHGADVGVLAVAFSPDGKAVAAVDEAAKVILYNATEPRQTTSLNTGMGGLGRRIMSLDLLTPEEKKVLLNKDRRQHIHSGAVAFSPDGKTLAVGGSCVVKLFDAQTGRLQLALEDKTLIEELKKLRGRVSEQLKRLAAVPHAHGSVHSVAFSPDGTLLVTSGGHIFEASGATRGQVKLWDAQTGQLKHDLGQHFGQVFSAAFSPDGKVLASAGVHTPAWTKSVRFWDPEAGRVKRVLQIPRGDPFSVTLSPDGRMVAAGGIVHHSEDDTTSGMLLVWNARTGALLQNRPLPSLVASLSFSADSKTLATGEHERGVTLWDPETLKPKAEIKPQTDLPRDVTGTVRVAFSPTGSLLAIGAENERHGFVTVWETGRPEELNVSERFPGAGPGRDEQDAVAALKELGARLQWADEDKTKVTEVDLSGTQVTDAGLAHLRPLATTVTASRPTGSLACVRLADTKITDAGLVHLKDFVNLQELWLADTQLTDTGLKSVEDLTSLKVLDLSRVGITDAGLVHVRGLTNLEALELDGTQVTDAGLVHLKGLKKLKKLRLHRTGVTGDGATELLRALPELDDCAGPRGPSKKPTSLPSDEEETVRKLKKLGAQVEFTRHGCVKSVSFNGVRLSDADLEGLIDSLKVLPDLEELDFSGTQITDAALAHLEHLAHLQLETLNLSGTQVTDEGVKHLNAHVNLHRLNLQDTKVTAGGVSELFLPGLYMFGYKGPEPPTVVPKKVLLVEADGAGEHSVLDLASGQTLPLTDKAIHDPSVFARMGKGDFWYGNSRIVCLRGAKAVYLESSDGFLEEEPYRGRTDMTVYKLPDAPRVEYSEDGEKKHFYRGRRLWITTAEKKHFLVKIVSVTREDDAVLEYQSAGNPFKTKWDPTFRKGLAGVAAIDLDTGRTLSEAPFPVEDWPDAMEFVWMPGDRAVLRKHGSPARVIQLDGVKNFDEATDQALKRFKELDESGEHDRSGAVSSLDAPGVGPWDARYFAVMTNRECLAVVELIPPPTEQQRRTLRDRLTEGWIKWSLGYVEQFRRELPPLVTPVRRLPSDIPRRL